MQFFRNSETTKDKHRFKEFCDKNIRRQIEQRFYAPKKNGVDEI